MKILLDSNVLIDLLRGKGEGLALVEEAALARAEFTTSVINVAEVHAGLRPGEEAKAGNLLSGLEVLPVTTPIAVAAGVLMRDWARKGRTLALPDMLVAATALEHSLTLATTNVNDFPMPDIALFRLT